MRNTMKKIGAIAHALVLVLSLSASAFAAADMNGESGVIGEFTAPDTATAKAKQVIIYKEITAYNPETCVVNAPTITYTYAIAGVAAGKNVIDAASVHATTKLGIVSGVKLDGTGDGDNDATIAWTPADKLNASSTGEKNTKTMTIDFSGVDFSATGAGVYRYQITETANSYVSSGVVDGGITNVRFLDVYVMDGSTEGTYDIYGYVLFTNNNDIVGDSTAADGNSVAAAVKTEGFVATTTPAASADQYYTFNFEVGKTVENDQYVKTTHHKFPFTITLANQIVTANVLPIATVKTNAEQVTALSAAPIAGEWSVKIADGSTIKYVGIPAGTTVTIKEQNDVVGAYYKSSSDGADTDAADKNIFYQDWSNEAIINCSAAGEAATENHTVIFTNELLQISPTGVVLRVAPYALMLGAGLFFVLLSKRRRAEPDEA